MRVTYDAEVDAAYISLKAMAVGESKHQVPVRGVDIPPVAVRVGWSRDTIGLGDSSSCLLRIGGREARAA